MYEINVEEIDAMFVFLGYSIQENGYGRIAIGYTVNSGVIEKYRSTTGLNLSYGLFAVSKNVLGENDIFGENGAIQGAFCTDISNYNLMILELKLAGFNTEEQKNIKLSMGAYVKIEGKEYSCLQGGIALNGEKYYFVSYNDILSALQ